MSTKKTKRIPVMIPEELHAKITAKSERTGISAAHIARQAWKQWVEDDPAEEQEETTPPQDSAS